jgi:hypothetical protein
VVKIPRFAFHLKTYVLALYDVDGLLPAEIRVLPPPPHDALGEDVLWLLDVLGSGYLKNWMIGVDASGCREAVMMQINCIIQMQKICNSANCAREAETCFLVRVQEITFPGGGFPVLDFF